MMAEQEPQPSVGGRHQPGETLGPRQRVQFGRRIGGRLLEPSVGIALHHDPAALIKRNAHAVAARPPIRSGLGAFGPLRQAAPIWGPRGRSPCPNSVRPARRRSTRGPGESTARLGRASKALSVPIGNDRFRLRRRGTAAGTRRNCRSRSCPRPRRRCPCRRRRSPGPNGWPVCPSRRSAGLRRRRRSGRSENASRGGPARPTIRCPSESVVETTLISAPGSEVTRSIGDHWFCGRIVAAAVDVPIAADVLAPGDPYVARPVDRHGGLPKIQQRLGDRQRRGPLFAVELHQPDLVAVAAWERTCGNRRGRRPPCPVRRRAGRPRRPPKPCRHARGRRPDNRCRSARRRIGSPWATAGR